MSVKEWNNVSGTTEIELHIHDGKVCDERQDRELPQELFDIIAPLTDLDNPDPFSLHIEWKSTGYYDPGRWGTRPEDGYPPEGADDRELVRVGLTKAVRSDATGIWNSVPCAELPRGLQEKLFAMFLKEVEKEELADIED